jgi:AAA15 family ATPase/GTPase
MSRSTFASVYSATGDDDLEDLVTGTTRILSGPDGEEMYIDATGKGIIKVREVQALHDVEKGEPIGLPLHEESDGSRRLLELLLALWDLVVKGGVYVIDEIERSMHPLLVRKFVEFFLRAVPVLETQLIFATHESTLLDLDLVRRDGIWLTEKDPEGATHLYSLAEFKVRKDLRIEKGYFHGRFGAVPFLGGIDTLIEEQAAAEAIA